MLLRTRTVLSTAIMVAVSTSVSSAEIACEQTLGNRHRSKITINIHDSVIDYKPCYLEREQCVYDVMRADDDLTTFISRRAYLNGTYVTIGSFDRSTRRLVIESVPMTIGSNSKNKS